MKRQNYRDGEQIGCFPGFTEGQEEAGKGSRGAAWDCDRLTRRILVKRGPFCVLTAVVVPGTDSRDEIPKNHTLEYTEISVYEATEI